MISLTGDVGTGRKMMTAAAKTIKRTHLELGGKAPVIVFDDADLAAVVEGVKIFGYYNAGQDCTAACRVYAGKKIYDKLVAELAGAVQTLKFKKPTTASTKSDRSSPPRQRARVLLRRPRPGEPYRDRHRRPGPRPGLLLQPTVVAGAQQADEIVRREVFGPVVSVTRFATSMRRSPGPMTPTTGSPRRSGLAT